MSSYMNIKLHVTLVDVELGGYLLPFRIASNRENLDTIDTNFQVLITYRTATYTG